VGISAEVLQDSLGAMKGRFAIDDPRLTVEPSYEWLEIFGVFEMIETVRKKKFPSLKGMFEEVQELASEQGRKDPDGHEESFPGGDPTVAVRRQATAGDDTVQVGMAHEILPPGMEKADDPHSGSEMFGVLGQFPQGLGGRAKQQIVEGLLVS